MKYYEAFFLFYLFIFIYLAALGLSSEKAMAPHSSTFA